MSQDTGSRCGRQSNRVADFTVTGEGNYVVGGRPHGFQHELQLIASSLRVRPCRSRVTVYDLRLQHTKGASHTPVCQIRSVRVNVLVDLLFFAIIHHPKHS